MHRLDIHLVVDDLYLAIHIGQEKIRILLIPADTSSGKRRQILCQSSL